MFHTHNYLADSKVSSLLVARPVGYAKHLKARGLIKRFSRSRKNTDPLLYSREVSPIRPESVNISSSNKGTVIFH